MTPIEADHGLETLLAMHGEKYHFANGYWTKFEVWTVEPNIHIPHGIRYSLTLHDRHNHRLLGYDNAHAIKKKKKYGARKVSWDHKHDQDTVENYEFETAASLMEDFWNDVNKILEDS